MYLQETQSARSYATSTAWLRLRGMHLAFNQHSEALRIFRFGSAIHHLSNTRFSFDTFGSTILFR